MIDENKFVCKDDYLSSSSLKEGSLNSGMEGGLCRFPAFLRALLDSSNQPGTLNRHPVIPPPRAGLTSAQDSSAAGGGGRGGRALQGWGDKSQF